MTIFYATKFVDGRIDYKTYSGELNAKQVIDWFFHEANEHHTCIAISQILQQITEKMARDSSFITPDAIEAMSELVKRRNNIRVILDKDMARRNSNS